MRFLAYERLYPFKLQFRVYSPHLKYGFQWFGKTSEVKEIMVPKDVNSYVSAPMVVEVMVHNYDEILKNESIHGLLIHTYHRFHMDAMVGFKNNIIICFCKLDAKTHSLEVVLELFMNVTNGDLRINHRHMNHDVWADMVSASDANQDSKFACMLRVLLPKCKFDYYDYETRNFFSSVVLMI